MVRIADVAKKAKVSTATVSRVLSNSVSVRKETAEKVTAAIKELNYQPNILARQLRTMETKTILVVISDISNPFFSKVLRGIKETAIHNGYQVLLGDIVNNAEQETNYLNIMRQRTADGMILLTARSDKETVESIANEFPVVLACEYIEGTTIPTVSIDNISSARKITEHLIKLNHKRIATLTGPLDVVLGRDRLKGFQQAMSQYDLPLDPFLIQEGDFTFESGYNLMSKLLASQNPPSAVFAASDEMAIGAIKAIKSFGLKVPEDISVVGFDDIKFASIIEPALTTIAQPAFEIGSKAMELLIMLLNDKELRNRQFILEDHLVVRESCGECKL